jgi:hypothetical protein
MSSSTNIPDFAFLGVLRCMVAFPVEQPLEVIKLKNQALPQLTSMQVIKSIYAENRLKGFFHGAIPNLAKRSIKEAYRWPAIAFFHSFWSSVLPDFARLDGAGAKIATAITIAGGEACILLPFERFLVTKVNENGYRAFYEKNFQKNGISSLYPGMFTAFLRQTVSLGVFMTLNHFVKREIHYMDPEQKHPIVGFVVGTAIIAGGLTLCLPLDFTKTHIQMHTEFQKMRVDQVARALLKKYGAAKGYAGKGPAFLHTLVHAFLGGALLDKITQPKNQH